MAGSIAPAIPTGPSSRWNACSTLPPRAPYSGDRPSAYRKDNFIIQTVSTFDIFVT